MNYGFMTLKALLIDYNQFNKSKLQPIIMNVLKCDYDHAFEIGKTLCNVISTWALLYCQELYKESFEVFYKTCLDKKLCTEKGFFNLDKPELFKALNVKCNIIKYDSIPEDLQKNQFFQIAINNKSHFMAGTSAEDGNIYLFDTNNRKYGFELMEALKDGDKITWIKKFEVI
jgi:hypothetical protein